VRHLLANVVTYTVAFSLLIGALLFGRMRASQYLLTKEPAVMAAHEPGDGTFAWGAVGARAYTANCRNCHGADGRGWDQYPPLTPARAHFQRPGGREFLIDLHLHGLESDRWRVPMPPMRHMHDAELAAVINHILVRFGGVDSTAALLRPAEIAARRGASLSPRMVDRTRPDDRPARTSADGGGGGDAAGGGGG
jgi:mono/diheme cytochrome c family protein